MMPTDVLMHEHKVVMLVLEGAANEALKIKKGGTADHDKIDKIVDFSRNFTDGCHHAKEERLLFPKMGEKGFMKDSGPVAVMLMEHVEGRRFIGNIERFNNELREGNEEARQNLADNILSYVMLLKNHIDKENNILFKMADKVLDENDNQILIEAFDKVEREETGEGAHEKYHQMAHEIYEG